MLTLIIGFLILSTGANALEAPWKNHENLLCKNEFEFFLTSKNLAKESFRQEVADHYDERVYRNLSNQIGSWSELHLFDKKRPFVIELNNHQFTKHTFTENCKVSTASHPLPEYLQKVFVRKTKEDWSDSDLKKIVSSGKKGIIYQWSPKFSYSVQAMAQVEFLAKKMGYEFTAVVDPRPENKEVLDSLSTLMPKWRNPASAPSSYKRNISLDLFMRTGFNHYPVSFVYNQGKIHSRWVTGIMTDKGFEDLVKTYVQELK